MLVCLVMDCGLLLLLLLIGARNTGEIFCVARGPKIGGLQAAFSVVCACMRLWRLQCLLRCGGLLRRLLRRLRLWPS